MNILVTLSVLGALRSLSGNKNWLCPSSFKKLAFCCLLSKGLYGPVTSSYSLKALSLILLYTKTTSTSGYSDPRALSSCLALFSLKPGETPYFSVTFSLSLPGRTSRASVQCVQRQFLLSLWLKCTLALQCTAFLERKHLLFILGSCLRDG